ncbi:MAG: protein kinase [Myxococcota bacterium]|nr:protein kinase [Myxococcota bacterium]
MLDRIAVGGMAEVFLAKAYGAHGFEKTIAIKKILPELARDAEFEARFIAEAKVAVRLSHANVVQVLDFGRIGESLFIAMEYVDGLDLAAMLRKFKDEKRLVPLPAAFHISIEIVRALDFAHSHNVVHRDVSPSNILISRAGEVKIADFGIAVAAQPHRVGGAGPKRVMGKWRYMSPEQTRGDTLDTRSDLFSAASVIYEIFTNEKLFPGEEAEDIIKNIADMPIPRMSSMRPGLPSRLDEVIAGPLSRKPIDRPHRPASVLRALIELSYESSIMATALDVAEALATVIPAKKISGRGALDDVIRKQLNEQSIARQTAVTNNKPPGTETALRQGDVSTGLFRKLDMDGVSRLEEVGEIEDTRVAAPRARRNSEQGLAMPGDTAEHEKFLQQQPIDRDRHTEVGGPPTGAVPKDLLAASNSSLPKQTTLTGKTDIGTSGGKGMMFAIIFAVLLAVGGGIWALTREKGNNTDNVVTPAPSDAGADAAKELFGQLTIDPVVEGATGYLEGGSSRQEIPAITHAKPYRVKVTANTKLHLHLEVPGYSPYDDANITVPPGETLLLRPSFATAPAKLSVITEPAGASVTLAGRLLGETPKTFEGIAPGTDLVLELSKAGYQPISKKVTLEPGKLFEVKETLKEATKFGSLTVTVKGMWAEVHFGGRNLGRNAGTGGPKTFSLPVGKQRITLVNPPSGKRKTIVVTIEANKPATVSETLE